MSAFRSPFARRVRRFRQDESGQALLAVGILSLALILFVTSVFPVGGAVRRRIRAQNAADAAALATGTWAARGCNVVNAANAFCYDIHVLSHLIIHGFTAKWIRKIYNDLDEGPLGLLQAAADWLDGRKEIGKVWDGLQWGLDYVNAGVMAATPGYNHLAIAEANEIARLMGADQISTNGMKAVFSSLGLAAPEEEFAGLDEELATWYGSGIFLYSLREAFKNLLEEIPVIGPLLGWAAEHLPEPKSELALYCWPLAPDFRPAQAYETTRLVKWPSVFSAEELPPEAGLPPFWSSSPLHTESYDPFLLDILFVKFFHWNHPYARLAGEKDGTKPDLEEDGIRYTAAVRFGEVAEKDSWFPSLAKLWFGGENAVTAVSSVHVKGDRLTDAGCKTANRWYLSMGAFAFSCWPLPLIRAWAYGGEFACEPCPVVFRKNWKGDETYGEAKLVFH